MTNMTLVFVVSCLYHIHLYAWLMGVCVCVSILNVYVCVFQTEGAALARGVSTQLEMVDV